MVLGCWEYSVEVDTLTGHMGAVEGTDLFNHTLIWGKTSLLFAVVNL